MASIYTNADSNTRKTWFLVTGFLVFVIAVGYLFSQALGSDAILYVAVFLSIAMSFGSYWWSDKLVLSMAGAKLIERNDNIELYRLVENLCITAGLPVPKIYIINEMQPNAFATGRDKNHAVVAVTQGLLQRLNKTELEGVLAHELSHIGNKDMLLSTMVVVLAGVVALLANFFLRISFFGGGRRSRNNDGAAILMIAGLIAAILAPIAATLIQLAISRKRESLADASGALLTRYPEGLASALEKIAQDPTPMPSANTATSHLYIESPFKEDSGKGSWFVKLFSTHPPIEERVKALRDMEV
jgi:heat shock protein HtpX